jgi:hypothetical protein
LDVKLANNYQYQGQFIDTENIIHRDERKNTQVTDKVIYPAIV